MRVVLQVGEEITCLVTEILGSVARPEGVKFFRFVSFLTVLVTGVVGYRGDTGILNQGRRSTWYSYVPSSIRHSLPFI